MTPPGDRRGAAAQPISMWSGRSSGIQVPNSVVFGLPALSAQAWSPVPASLRRSSPCGKERGACPSSSFFFAVPDRPARCGSSVVEHPLGKGEVVGSIPSRSTSFHQQQRLAHRAPPSFSQFSAMNKSRESPSKLGELCLTDVLTQVGVHDGDHRDRPHLPVDRAAQKRKTRAEARRAKQKETQSRQRSLGRNSILLLEGLPKYLMEGCQLYLAPSPRRNPKELLQRQQKHHEQHDQSRHGHTGAEAIVVEATHDTTHCEALHILQCKQVSPYAGSSPPAWHGAAR